MERKVLQFRGWYGVMIRWEMECGHVLFIPQRELSRWTKALREKLPMPCHTCLNPLTPPFHLARL